MRVTQSMLSNNMLRNLSSSYDRLGKYQDQLSTGKKITKPSDDPVVAMKSIAYRTNSEEVAQFKRNFSEAHNWIDNSDAALDKVTLVMQRIRELTVQASNGTYEENQRGSIGEEVKQLKKELISLTNTKVGNKYLFNGTNTTIQPVTENADGTVSFSGAGGDVQIELSKGIMIGVNVKPDGVFSEELFEDLKKLEDALDPNSGNTNADIGSFLGKLDTHMDSIVNARAELGARQNRIELMEDRIDFQEVTAKRMLTDNEDADIEKVITDLTSQESVHRAALSVGARIIQPSLMDFLR